MRGNVRRYDRFDRPIHRVWQRSRPLSPLLANTPTGPSRETSPSKRSDAARELPANNPKVPSQDDNHRAVSDSFRPSGRSPCGTGQSLSAPSADVSMADHGSKRCRLPDTHKYGPTSQDSYKPRTGPMDSYRLDTDQRQPEEAKVKSEPSEDRSWFINVHGSSVQYEKTSSSYDQPRQRANDPMQALPQAALLKETAYMDRPLALPLSRKRVKHIAVLQERQSKLEDDITKAMAGGADEQSSAIIRSRRPLSVLAQELQTAQQGIKLDQVPTSKVQESIPSKKVNPQRIQEVEHKIFKLETTIAEADGEPNTAAIVRSKRFLVIARQELRDLENRRKVPVTPRLRTPRERYEEVRTMEQRQAQKNVKVLRGKQGNLQSMMSALQRSLRQLTQKPDVQLAISDDEEDGDVSLKQTVDQQHSALLIQANDLKQALHACEVDDMYCASSPMNQPYICLFGCKGVCNRNFQKAYPEISNFVMEIEHEIEKLMRHATLQEKAASKLNSMNQLQMPVIGGKIDAVERSMDGMSLKRKHDWMEEEEMPAKMLDLLDSEDDEEEDEDDDQRRNKL